MAETKQALAGANSTLTIEGLVIKSCSRDPACCRMFDDEDPDV